MQQLTEQCSQLTLEALCCAFACRVALQLKFSADAAKVKSLWFNPRLVSGLSELQRFASHVSRAADAAVEAKVGYPLQRQWLRR